MRGRSAIPAVCLAVLIGAGCRAPAPSGPSPWPAGTWVDLTHTFSDETVYWPTSGGFELEVLSAETTEKGYYYAANRFATAEHGGTHIDAPVHFYEGRHAVDEIPLERLVGPGVVLDVSRAALADRHHEVGVDAFLDWEREHGRIPDGAIVLLRTGYGRYWPDRLAYMGSEKRGAAGVAELSFPGLAPSAARWLVEQRDIAAIGLDTPSIDTGRSTHYESHVALFEANIPAFENVANLDRLPSTGALVIALPMKIAGGSGGPLRIVALIPDGVRGP